MLLYSHRPKGQLVKVDQEYLEHRLLSLLPLPQHQGKERKLRQV
jgi:hypothetical protein